LKKVSTYKEALKTQKLRKKLNNFQGIEAVLVTTRLIGHGAVKFEDPTVLVKINSVFVTIEPQGGSFKPSGNQLLCAYLSNHRNDP
jgi:hypothetical protein